MRSDGAQRFVLGLNLSLNTVPQRVLAAVPSNGRLLPPHLANGHLHHLQVLSDAVIANSFHGEADAWSSTVGGDRPVGTKLLLFSTKGKESLFTLNKNSWANRGCLCVGHHCLVSMLCHQGHCHFPPRPFSPVL